MVVFATVLSSPVFFVSDRMKLKVKIKPRSSKNDVRELPDGSWVVSVQASPTDGKANEMLREVLAEYFGKPKRNIVIRSGLTSRFKILEIT